MIKEEIRGGLTTRGGASAQVAAGRGMASASTATARSGPQISGLMSSASSTSPSSVASCGQAGDRGHDRVQVGGGLAAYPGQQPGHPQRAQHPVRLPRADRGQRHGPVGEQFHQHPARAHHQQRAELVVPGQAEGQLGTRPGSSRRPAPGGPAAQPDPDRRPASASGSRMPSTTPPASDLCAMPGSPVLSTTG